MQQRRLLLLLLLLMMVLVFACMAQGARLLRAHGHIALAGCGCGRVMGGPAIGRQPARASHGARGGGKGRQGLERVSGCAGACASPRQRAGAVLLGELLQWELGVRFTY